MLIRVYGLMGQLQKAAAAFDEMQRLGFWQPSDVRTANALLNALHTDATETYKRYFMLFRLCACMQVIATSYIRGACAVLSWLCVLYVPAFDMADHKITVVIKQGRRIT